MATDAGWAQAFGVWALQAWGDRWKFGEIDRDAVRAAKRAFRAEWRAALRATPPSSSAPAEE